MHFVWATWNHEPVITEAIERELFRYIRGICSDSNCPVIAIGGMPDHIHLLVSLSNTVTVADLMEKVKGGSSRFASNSLAPDGWFKWQGSYGAFSVSSHEKRKVVHYIENQKRHHAEGVVWEHAEQTHSISDKAAR